MKDLKELLKDLLESMDRDTFFYYFPSEEYFSKHEGAFKDEGDDFSIPLLQL
jgi:hypothetical protein